MTKEELEKATGQELIEQRDYCGVDGYYGDYLDDVNAEMLKRFNRLAELEKENAELKHTIATVRQEKDNVSMHAKAMEVVAKTRSDQLTKAKEIIREFVHHYKAKTIYIENMQDLLEQAEQFLNEVEK